MYANLTSGFESRHQQGTATSNSISGGLGGQLGLQNTSLLQQQLLQAAGSGGGAMNGLQVTTPNPSHLSPVTESRRLMNTTSNVSIPLIADGGGGGGGE